MQSACRRCCGQRQRRGCSYVRSACRWGALWPTPAAGVQLRAVGMHVGMQAVLWPTPAQGVQLRAVGMQSACRRGMQAVCRWGALWPTPAQGVQLHAVGMQSACSRHAVMQAAHACMQVGRAVANAGAGGAAACGRHAVGMQAGHAGSIQVGRAVANAGAGELRAVGMQSAACRRHAGGACTSWLVEFRVGCKAVKLCCNGGKLCCKRGKWLFKWAKFKILRPYLSDLQLISGVYKLFISRNMQATCKHGKNLFGT